MAIEITGSKSEVCVGEKISLGVKYTKEWGALKSVEWSIPGTCVKNYTDGQTTATVTKIVDADKKRFTIDFYWVDGANGRVVEAKCVFTSNGKDVNKTISATFDVKAPTLDSFSATTDSVGLDPPSAPAYLRFGISNKRGIKWNWKVTVPTRCDGYIKDVQTVKCVLKDTPISGNKQVFTISGLKVPPPSEQLDTDNPYSLPGDYPPCPGFPKKISAGGSFSDISTFDSPSISLAGGKERSFDHTFKYYLMYKPDTPDAIWVPIWKADWYCKGVAKLDSSGNWTVSGNSGRVSAAGSATTEFPEYASNAKSNTWQNE